MTLQELFNNTQSSVAMSSLKFPSAIVDSHLHLLNPNLSYSWLQDAPSYNEHDWSEERYKEEAGTLPLSAGVFVEADVDSTHRKQEAQWIYENPFVKGVVAAVAVEDGGIAVSEHIDAIAHPKLKGVRRLLQGEHLDFCLQPSYLEGMRVIQHKKLSFDICIKHHQLPSIISLVRQFPECMFILDHMGKPDIRHGVLEPWSSHIIALAAYPNVMCKISGATTEADHDNWTTDQLAPFISHAVATFGFNRVLWGSDWFVSVVATSVPRWVDSVMAIMETHCHATNEDVEKLFYSNAVRLYNLPLAPRGGGGIENRLA
eukprot:GILJ01008849.1.p1 GENE.GILJ01008849.1~~GILJ01008849.1.p1  ORF type:complete len:316 (-),score=41.82 GILJ01008849.1:97-1044(-)